MYAVWQNHVETVAIIVEAGANLTDLRQHPRLNRLDRYLSSDSDIVALMVLVVTLMHYNTAMHIHAAHGIYRRLYYFPIILVVSAVAAIVGTYLKPPTDEETLKNFYKNVKPWGFWKPIHDKVVAEDPGFEGNKDFWMDMFNVVVGTIAQTALVIFPIYIVLKKALPMGISMAIIVVCFIIMKRTWWDRLPTE